MEEVLLVKFLMKNSTVIPPTGISLSEDVDATYGFIFTEYDQNLRVLRGCYEGVESPKKVGNVLEITSPIAT